MISIEELRKIDPRLIEKSDEEVIKIRSYLYALGQLAFDSWLETKDSSKFPPRVMD